MKKLHLAIFVVMFPVLLYSQADTTEAEDDIETLLEYNTQDKEDSQVYDLFEYLINNPIILNTASFKDLLQIPFLNISTASAIIHCMSITDHTCALRLLKQRSFSPSQLPIGV